MSRLSLGGDVRPAGRKNLQFAPTKHPALDLARDRLQLAGECEKGLMGENVTKSGQDRVQRPIPMGQGFATWWNSKGTFPSSSPLSANAFHIQVQSLQ